jgi:hypothetical protein
MTPKARTGIDLNQAGPTRLIAVSLPPQAFSSNQASRYGACTAGPTGIFTRDTHVVVRKMEKLEW